MQSGRMLNLKSSRRLYCDAFLPRLKRKTLVFHIHAGGKKIKCLNCLRELHSIKLFSLEKFCVEVARQNKKSTNKIMLIFKFSIKDFQNCLVQAATDCPAAAIK